VLPDADATGTDVACWIRDFEGLKKTAKKKENTKITGLQRLRCLTTNLPDESAALHLYRRVPMQSGSEFFAGSLKERPGARPGLSVQTVVGLSSDALLLATTQHQEATDEQRQPTTG
jgi:hypothetical protein